MLAVCLADAKIEEKKQERIEDKSEDKSEERFLHFAASTRFASSEKDWSLRSE
jgi:hypothetical protein